MKVIIAGSRDFNDYDRLRSYCDHVLQNQTEVEIVSGAARGADQMGERYANEKGYPIKRFKPDWDRLGKSAGYVRNSDMAEYADALIAFWDGSSKGSEHMINIATKHNLKIRIYKYEVGN
jgi:hypothetical protein